MTWLVLWAAVAALSPVAVVLAAHLQDRWDLAEDRRIRAGLKAELDELGRQAVDEARKGVGRG